MQPARCRDQEHESLLAIYTHRGSKAAGMQIKDSVCWRMESMQLCLECITSMQVVSVSVSVRVRVRVRALVRVRCSCAH